MLDKFTIGPNGSVRHHGHQRGPMVLTHYSHRGRLMAIREAGHKYWSSIGHQDYEPAAWRLYRVESVQAGRDGPIITAEWAGFDIYAAGSPSSRQHDTRRALEALDRVIGEEAGQ
jgi:hypothetical protein